MSAAEIVWRARDAARREAWVFRQVRPGTQSFPPRSPRHCGFAPVLPPGTRDAVPREIRDSLVEAADGVLAGQWKVLGVLRTDLRAPDWFRDPITGIRAPQDKYAFRVNHRSEAETGNVKQIWELSRHQHLTILAAAWFVTGDADYAEAAAGQLRSWWSENTFLSGINWTSGIELGLRLVAWVWMRRLLDGWSGATSLFEDNGVARSQVFWHQRYLATFKSRGSSANNHVIAEAAGQLAASCAFPWFAESDRWRSEAARLLERELCANTFPSGLDREQAFDYHGFVAELGVLAAVEAGVFGQPLSDDTWRRLCRMIDAAASVVDESQRAPRQGDSDEGRALVVDAPDVNRWTSLFSTGAALFDPAPWWPKTTPSMMSVLLGSLSGRRPVASGRPGRRSSQFPDAGLALLRTHPGERPEICLVISVVKYLMGLILKISFPSAKVRKDYSWQPTVSVLMPCFNE
ncbi:MAG: heparinase II/III family protein, partial [Acidimicrobiales bacterium]